MIQGLDQTESWARCLLSSIAAEDDRHSAYVLDYWSLRGHGGEPPARPDVGRLYDSSSSARDDRWHLPLLDLPGSLAHMQGVRERVRDCLCSGVEDHRRDYLAQDGVLHADMHTEAFTNSRQTLGYPTPAIGTTPNPAWQVAGLVGDADIPGADLLARRRGGGRLRSRQ